MRAAIAAATLVVALVVGALVLAQGNGDATVEAGVYLADIRAAPYTEWAFEPNVPAGYYVGIEPHGMILRTFVNDVALQDIEGDATTFSDGAIIVKENHMPGDFDISGMEPPAPVEGFAGNLAALTFMVKIEGFNPEAGDWFWAKTGAEEGTFDAVGAAEGCIACHADAAGDDYVFNTGPGGM